MGRSVCVRPFGFGTAGTQQGPSNAALRQPTPVRRGPARLAGQDDRPGGHPVVAVGRHGRNSGAGALTPQGSLSETDALYSDGPAIRAHEDHDRVLHRLKLRAEGCRSGGRACARVPGRGDHHDSELGWPLRSAEGWHSHLPEIEAWTARREGRDRRAAAFVFLNVTVVTTPGPARRPNAPAHCAPLRFSSVSGT